MFTLGCEFTLHNFLIGILGGLVATLVLPGCYTTVPRLIRMNDGELRFYWGAVGRIVVAGIGGCVVDCNCRNTFFGGFFAWHTFGWLAEAGWSAIKHKLQILFGKKGD